MLDTKEKTLEEELGLEDYPFDEIDNYFHSFDVEVREGVRQALSYFDCCEDALKILEIMKEYDLENDRKIAEGRGRRARQVRRRKPEIKEPTAPVAVVGVCGYCEGIVKGMSLPSCEREESGRVFYEECTQCDYYKEVLNIDGVITEFSNKEGG